MSIRQVALSPRPSRLIVAAAAVGLSLAVSRAAFTTLTPGELLRVYAYTVQTAEVLRTAVVEFITPFASLLFIPIGLAWIVCKRAQRSWLHQCASILLTTALAFLIVTVSDIGLAVLPFDSDNVRRIRQTLELLSAFADRPWWNWVLLYSAGVAIVLRSHRGSVLARWHAVTFMHRVQDALSGLHTILLVLVQFGLHTIVASSIVVSTIGLAAPALVRPALQTRAEIELERTGASAESQDYRADLERIVQVSHRPLAPGQVKAQTVDGMYAAVATGVKSLPGIDNAPSFVADWIVGRAEPWAKSRMAALYDVLGDARNGREKSAPTAPDPASNRDGFRQRLDPSPLQDLVPGPDGRRSQDHPVVEAP